MKKQYILKQYTNKRPLLDNDFYGWANYDWIKLNQIPEDEVKYTHFITTQSSINIQLREILENNNFLLATTLYKSFIDQKYRHKYSLLQLIKLLSIVDNINSRQKLIITAAKLSYIGISTIYNLFIDANLYNSNENICYIDEASLGLPNRDYYYDEKYKHILQKYYETICLIYKELYPLMSINELNNKAKLIIDIEKKISIILMSNTDRRNSNLIFHLTNYKTLKTKYKNLYINLFIKTLCKLTHNTVSKHRFNNIILTHYPNDDMNYFKQLELILDSYNLKEMSEYFKFRIMLSYMSFTTDKMKEIYFDMFKKTINGQAKQKELWVSGLLYSCSTFNDAISRIYSKTYFDNIKEAYMFEMVKNIKLAVKERIEQLDWMSQETKIKALNKLEKMVLKLGYSKTNPIDYSTVKLSNFIIHNVMQMNAFNSKYELNKLNKPINPNEWDTEAYIVNAYFNPTRNEIIFPAAILQPPFLDINATDLYNYGHIGSVIGHEIIHGFDDEGSKFDENGTLNDWWLQSDSKKYEDKVKTIIAIYDNEGINGKLTAGENIADFGAVIMPLIGLKYKLGRELTTEEIQKFFISYANHWQNLIRPEAINDRILSDPHAFGDLRVNIPLKHNHYFQNVFNINKNSNMYVSNDDILTIW